MTKPSIPFRIPNETARQLSRLMAYEGQSNKSALLVAAIEERYIRQHGQIHFDMAQIETGVCPWCGWDATKSM